MTHAGGENWDERFVQSVVRRGSNWYLLGRSRNDVPDDYLLDARGQLIVCTSLEETQVRGSENGLLSDGRPLELNEYVQDLDEAERLSGRRPADDRETEVVLEAWNFLDDVCRSVGRPLRFHGATANRAYDKLFWGLNLPGPGLTPPGEHYVPQWSERETRKIRQVIAAGLKRLDARLGA